MLYQPLYEVDQEIYNLIKKEEERQKHGLELIASENFTSRSVMEANGSCLTNKYSEGLPGMRYYGGNVFIDQIETICQKRALECFGLSDEEWGVNVQAYSGSVANFAVYTALLKPHDRLMGLDLPSGGHLTHGYKTATKKISASAIYFNSLGYKIKADTGLIDYDTLEEQAREFQPHLIICGGSAYPRDWDYARFRHIADTCCTRNGSENGKALLMADIAHSAGLIAGKQLKSPFEWCDVVTTTTHKTLRGPRGALIFFRKHLENKINFAVFPSCQGGPHNNTIAAIAVALKQAKSYDFHTYCEQVVKNARSLSASLQAYGYKIVTDGTDNHLLLWDLRPLGITGSKLETLCDEVSITINKNAVHGDKSALNPGGARLGVSALTTRGFKENDFKTTADFLHRAVQLTLSLDKEIRKRHKDCSLSVFREVLKHDERVHQLYRQVEQFAKQFNIPHTTL